MKVDLISEHASPISDVGGAEAGGQNVHVESLARGLAQRGARVRVVTRRSSPDLPDVVPLAPGVEVHHVDAGPPGRLARDELWGHLDQFAAELADLWQDDRPDVAHAHFWMSGVAARAAAATVPVPVALTFHAFGAEKRRHQGDADTSPAARIGEEARLCRSVDLIIATTRWECRMHLAAGVPPERIVQVPCGVDVEAFRPAAELDRPVRGRPYTIGLLGRLVDRKGVLDLFEALASVPEARLVVAGGEHECGPDPAVDRYRDAARAMGVGERVRFLGPVSRARVPAFLRSVDVVACCPWYEPFGLVALEAMACGVPVVATQVGGLAETVVHGVTGLHVPPRSPDDLAAALRTLQADAEMRRRMGRAGRHRALRYSWDRVSARTLVALERLGGRTEQHDEVEAVA